MVTRTLSLLALAGACACHGGVSRSYDLRVTPSSRAVMEADRLTIGLQRLDASESQSVELALPRPPPAAPWRLEVRSGVWGAAPFSVTVTASAGGVAVARGSGAPTNRTIEVVLADLAAMGDLAVADALDLSTPDLTTPDLLTLDLTAPDLTAPPDLACPVTRLALMALADTEISSGAPTGPAQGGGAILNIGTGIGSVGLIRFDVSALPASAKLQRLQVTLTPAPLSSACSGGCGSCAGIEMTGGMQLYYMRNDWDEMTAVWNLRSTGNAWGTNGASGSSDRSAAAIAQVVHTASTPLAFDVASANFSDLALWRAANQLSFEVSPIAGVIVAASRESAGDGCVAGGYPAASLTIDYCP